MVDDIIITASFFEQNSQKHERKNWLCGLEQRGNLVRSLVFPLFWILYLFSYGLGIQEDWVIRALYQETQLRSHSGELRRRCFIKKQQHWNVKCDRNLCFCLFRNSCSLERYCLMTASKNPENITVQLLSSFGHCPVYIFPYGSKLQTFLPKCGLFNQVPDYLPVQNVWRASKIQEMKDLKKSKTKTSKPKTTKAKTPKYFFKESFVFVCFITVVPWREIAW